MKVSSIATLLILTAVPASADPVPIEACYDLDTCVAKCGKGGALACLRAGELLSPGEIATTTKAADAVEPVLVKQCDAKLGRACYLAGALHCTTDGKFRSPDGTCDTTADARFVKGCDAGDGASCVGVAHDMHFGEGGRNADVAAAEKMAVKAMNLLETGCSAGKADDCSSLSLLPALAGSVPNALHLLAHEASYAARALSARDCEMGDGRACSARVEWLLYLPGPDRDASVAKLCKLAPKAEYCLNRTTIGAPMKFGSIGEGTNWTRPAGKAGATPTVSVGQPTSTGDLDKAIIRRYIKRNQQKIQYCYEKQLMTKPTITGTVTISFTIAKDGTVSASQGSGFDGDVAHCVADVIKGIEFPKPAGGDVKVNYPFTFKQANL